MKLWIVMSYNYGEEDWEFGGVFDTEKAAADQCVNEEDYIGPAIVNEVFPVSEDWEGAYHPLVEDRDGNPRFNVERN